MSNGHKLELMTWGDGHIHLAYWDSLEGKDRIFRLEEWVNPQTLKNEVICFEELYSDSDPDENPDEEPTLERIDDLPWVLVRLCKQLEKRDADDTETD